MGRWQLRVFRLRPKVQRVRGVVYSKRTGVSGAEGPSGAQLHQLQLQEWTSG